MSEDALYARRALRKQKMRKQKMQKGPQPILPAELPEDRGLSAEQEELIEILTEAHKKHFDSTFSQFIHYQVSH
ncbi:Nuclear receptor subfamily 1 group I member 2, partial [Ophiophagus hannah]